MAIFHNIKAVESLRIPAFRMYFFSRLADSAAVFTRQMSLLLLMYYLTGSVTLLGVLTLARAIPLMLVAPLAGAIADRIQKKHVIQAANVVDVVLSLGIAFGLVSGYLSEGNSAAAWVLIAFSMVDGISTSFKGPANDAMVIEVVGEDLITNAIALSQAGRNILLLVSPTLAGLIIDAYGFDVLYFIMAALYVLSVVFMLLVPRTSRPVATAGVPITKDIGDVFRYLRREPNLLLVLGAVFGMVFLSMPYRQLLPVFTTDILKVDATGYGILNGITGVGSIAGSVMMASLPNSRRRGLILLLGGVILGISLIFFAFSESWHLSLVLMAVVGIGQSVRMTLPVALLQSYSRSEYRARVMSFYGVQFGLSSFGAFFAAILADSIGIQWSVGGLAMGLAGLSLAAIVLLPRLRKMD